VVEAGKVRPMRRVRLFGMRARATSCVIIGAQPVPGCARGSFRLQMLAASPQENSRERARDRLLAEGAPGWLGLSSFDEAAALPVLVSVEAGPLDEAGATQSVRGKFAHPRSAEQAATQVELVGVALDQGSIGSDRPPSARETGRRASDMPKLDLRRQTRVHSIRGSDSVSAGWVCAEAAALGESRATP